MSYNNYHFYISNKSIHNFLDSKGRVKVSFEKSAIERQNSKISSKKSFTKISDSSKQSIPKVKEEDK